MVRHLKPILYGVFILIGSDGLIARFAHRNKVKVGLHDKIYVKK